MGAVNIENMKRNYKRLQSEFNVLKQVHVKVVDEYTTYRVESMKMDQKQRIIIDALKLRVKKANDIFKSEGYRFEV